jgi:hypothetical protein
MNYVLEECHDIASLKFPSRDVLTGKIFSRLLLTYMNVMFRDDQRMHRDQDYSGSRPHNPGMSSGGRGHRGGHRDYRARPY